MIVDRQGRQFRNLRVSLTAACNYACTYCVPNGQRLQPAAHELDAEQLLHAVRLLTHAGGIEALRITGGEPLLSPKFDLFAAGLSELKLRDIAITTNGQLIRRKADALLESGIQRANVSLDTLDASRFKSIARGGDLATVLDGIDLLRDAGWRLKINMVPMRRANVDQILPLLDYCFERDIELRFIELMNMGHLRSSNDFQLDFFGMEEILELIATRYTYRRANAPFDSTATRFEVPGHGSFGIIANESAPFCSGCTRLRLASNGDLYGCLSSSRHQSMRHLLEMPEYAALPKLQGLLQQALGHKQSVSFRGETTVMKFIGG
ncbi:MAG: radical SAM protein [Pseudomonadota bacterium]